MALTIGSALAQAKNRLHGGEAIVWLVEITRRDGRFVRVAKWPDSVTYKGNTFARAPVEIADVDEELGTLTELKVAIGDPTGTIWDYIGRDATPGPGSEILDKKATLILCPESSFGANYGAIEWAYYVETASRDNMTTTFTLSFGKIGEIAFPRDRFIRRSCRWTFKDATTCQYAGALATCDKTYDTSSGCKGRDNQVNYGAFLDLMTGDETVPLQ